VRTHSTSHAARLAAVFVGVLLVASVPVGLAADASDADPGAGTARADASALETRAKAATLELYALGTQLGRAREAVASIATQRAELARESASARQRLEIARGALRVSQTRLAELVRALYEQTGSSDPLAIVLGSGSLEEALAGLDSLSRSAGENTRIIDQARAARTRLGRLNARLTAKEAALRQLAATAQSRAAELASAAAARQRYLAGLRAQQHLNARRIAAIEADARAAQARTATISAAAKPANAASAQAPEAAAPTPEAAPAPAAEAVAPQEGRRSLTVSSTGYALRGRTATGVYTAHGVIAVDPSVIPLGTRMTIPGYGEGIAADTGGAVHGNVIDLWFPTVEEALQWGRRTVTIVIH